MPPDLHLHPDRLRGHAARAAALSEDLRAVLRHVPAPQGQVLDAEQERLCALATGAARELAELSAALAAAATEAAAADTAAADRIARADDMGHA
ncbi:hypothetical protein [Pseudonocardia nigra]|uniref:hypothetical protein n=1 Tax=Pseudonocardia nigra TaxID=1921578 RepID=UPI001C5EEFDB|nr:hypothetical protein [Pseudonocardia nigra]